MKGWQIALACAFAWLFFTQLSGGDMGGFSMPSLGGGDSTGSYGHYESAKPMWQYEGGSSKGNY